MASVASFWRHAFLGIALVLSVAFVIALYAWGARAEADRLRELQSCSNLLVRNVEVRLAALRKRLDALAIDPQLRQALHSDDPETLRRQSATLAALMPQAEAVKILPAGSGSAATDAAKLSYAGLDLIRMAEQQRRVTALEIHRLGQPDVHLAIAGPVLNETGTAAIGVLHLALPLSWLPALPSQTASAGRLGFQQEVGPRAVTVDPERGVVLPSEDADLVEDIPHTRLRVAGWVAPASVPLSFAGLAYVLVMALVAFVLWFFLGNLKRALAADYGAIVRLAEDAGAGRPLKPVRPRLAETHPVVEVLSRVLQGVPRARVKPPAAASLPKRETPAEPVEAGGRSSAGRSEPDTVPRSAVRGGATGPSPEATPSPTLPVPGSPSRLRIDPVSVPDRIFRAYDIRGLVGVDLTPDRMHAIGLAVGSEAAEAGDQRVMVARDTRPSGEELSRALIDGVLASGCDVVDLGIAPSPLLYFATCYQGRISGVMVTGSHNPENHNGVKVVIHGIALEGDRIRELRDRILQGRFTQGEGSLQEEDLVRAYVDRVEKDVAVAYTMKVVVDCGNGAAALVAPLLYTSLGCEVVQTDCDPQAGFPGGRVPDPTRPECLEALQRRVVEEKADLGLAFDPDGDRLGVVDSSGKIIWSDRVLMLLAADVLSRHPGTDIVFDVKSSHYLATQILRNGGRPVMWRSGHSPLKAKLLETGGLLAGEWSGHIMFRERWYGFDDAIYAGARLLEVLALDPRPSAEVFLALPEAVATPELIVPLDDGEPDRVMDAVMRQADRLDGVSVQTIDGLRADSERGWGLVRASNTQSALTFRFEGDDEAALAEMEDLFRRLLAQAAPDLELPF